MSASHLHGYGRLIVQHVGMKIYGRLSDRGATAEPGREGSCGQPSDLPSSLLEQVPLARDEHGAGLTRGGDAAAGARLVRYR